MLSLCFSEFQLRILSSQLSDCKLCCEDLVLSLQFFERCLGFGSLTLSFLPLLRRCTILWRSVHWDVASSLLRQMGDLCWRQWGRCNNDICFVVRWLFFLLILARWLLYPLLLLLFSCLQSFLQGRDTIANSTEFLAKHFQRISDDVLATFLAISDFGAISFDACPDLRPNQLIINLLKAMTQPSAQYCRLHASVISNYFNISTRYDIVNVSRHTCIGSDLLLLHYAEQL
mmetsp:Transcript_113046/g.177842  ORF Transcript_113046/g.177842 Transcript_113046/m.177842 type:complete len:230 (+) Transcript_113046:128-817(+)